MTISQRRTLIERINSIESDIQTLERVLVEISSSGYASATISTSQGSKSYTRANVNDIQKTILFLRKELRRLNNKLFGRSNFTPTTVLTIYS